MSAAPAFCRLVLGNSEAATAVADAVGAAPPSRYRVDEIAGAWVACRPELERRRDALAWDDVAPGQPSLAAGLAALGDFERGAVAAQALGLTPEEVEQALGAGPGAARGLLARAHAGLAGFGRSPGAGCAEQRERLAVAPAGTRTEHCADCRAFAAAVDEQRLALRRAAGAVKAAPTKRRDEEPRSGSAPTGAGPGRQAAAAQRATAPAEPAPPVASPVGRPGSAVAARLRSASGGRGSAAAAVTRVRSAASTTLPHILEPEERGPRIAVALAALLLGGLVGYGAVSALETPREGGRDSGVVTATPVGPLPPGVGPTKP